MLRGNANQSKPSHATDGRSARATGFLAEGNRASVANPMQIRTKETPLGPMERRPSAMKRKEAPQMRPGIMRSSHPLVNYSIIASIAKGRPGAPESPRPHSESNERDKAA